jgi:hypothetical protein
MYFVKMNVAILEKLLLFFDILWTVHHDIFA